MLKSSLCDYSDTYILVKGKLTITGKEADVAASQEHKRDKGVIFKNCTPFINCKTKINNTKFLSSRQTFYCLWKVKMIEYHIQNIIFQKQKKDYNLKIDGKSFSDQPINNDTKTYENIRKIVTGQRDYYTTGCLLDYHYFE